MKRFSLLLVTALVAATTFALEGIGSLEAGVELSIPNAGGANEQKALLGLEPYVAYSRKFGDLNLAATIGDYAEIATDDRNDKVLDDFYLEVTPSYSRIAGPGTLALYLTLKPVFHLADYGKKELPGPDFLFNPYISYGFDVSLGSLFLTLATTDDYFNGLGMKDGANKTGDGYGLVLDDLYFRLSMYLDNVFYFWISPHFSIATSGSEGEKSGLQYLRLYERYVFLRQPWMAVSLEIAVPMMEDRMKYWGLSLEPRISAVFGSLSAWFALQVDGIANEVKADSVITPSLGVSYRF